MADLYDYQTDTGIIVPDTGQVQTDVENEYKEQFGTDLIVTPDTPQGMLIAAEVLARVAVITNNANVANQLNPDLAGGVFLDAILAFTGLSRTLATKSTVGVTITGTPGTILPVGTQARETVNNELFQNQGAITIPGSGTITATFESVNTGAIACAAGTLTQIVTPVLGWDAITNAAGASLGQATQSDVQTRQFRKDALAAQGSSLAGAIIAGVLQVEDVKSLTFRENYTNVLATIDSIAMFPHSLYMCIDGGTNANVAAAIVDKKSGGCNFQRAVQTGTLTGASAIVTGLADTTNLSVGLKVTGTDVPADTRILTVDSSTQITMDANATGSGAQSLTFTQGKSEDTITQDVTVVISGQVIPVVFDRPDQIGIDVQATVQVLDSSITDPDSVIKTAILDYAAGNVSGEPGLVVGANVSPFELSGAVALAAPGIYIQKMEVKKSSSGVWLTTEVVIELWELGVITEGSITVVSS